MGDLAKDKIGGGGPDKRLRVAIVGGDVIEDGLPEMGHGADAASADGLFGDLGKPALDLVEPGAVGGDEVQMAAWVWRASQRRTAGALCAA